MPPGRRSARDLGDSVRAQPVADLGVLLDDDLVGLLMARTLGLMLVTGATLAQVWVLVPHSPWANVAALEALILVAVLAGGALLSPLGRLLPPPAFQVVLPGVLAVVALAHLAAGPGRTGFSFFFLWLTPWVFYFFGRTFAVTHSLLVVATAGLVLVVEVGGSPAVAWQSGSVSVWLLLVGTSAALGVLGALARELSTVAADRERQLRTMVDGPLTPTALVCEEGLVVRVNVPFAALLDTTRDALVGVSAAAIGLTPGLTGPGTYDEGEPRELEVRRADGAGVWVRVAALPVSFGRTFTGRVLQLQDLTDHKRAEEEAAALEEERERAEQDLITRAVRQETLVEFARQALSTDDLDLVLGRVVEVVAAVLAVPMVSVVSTGEEGAGLRMVAGLGWEAGPVRHLQLAPGLGSHSGYALENGTTVSDLETEHRFAVHPMLTAGGAVAGVACPVPTRQQPFMVINAYTDREHRFAAEDVTTLEMLASIVAAAVDRHTAEQAHRRNAVHDALTGLPNRTLFVDRLDMALDRAAQDGCADEVAGGVAVVLLDVDGFKAVNDSLGHGAGDELLLALAPRLRSVLRPGDTVARLSGDEFAVLLPDVGPDEVLDLARQVTQAWARPFVVAGNELHVTASVGVAVLERASAAGPRSAFGLLQDAGTAMYRAKECGRGQVELYDAQVRDRALARLELETAMRAALADDAFSVAYQPVVTTGDGVVCAVEALARWTHPVRGPIGPDEFIPVAESSGLVVELGTWMLRSACRQVAEWRAGVPGAEHLRVNVNASPRQLTDPGFVDSVAAALHESGLPADALGLEITESLLVEDGSAANRVLEPITEMGVRIILDDFGTGYSSLSYLKAFPVDSIKIDRSFVAGLGHDQDDTAIVSAIITMAHSLGLEVVGEGVETDQHRRRLVELGCDYGQGYFYARPMPATELESTLRDGRRTTTGGR